MIVAIILSGVVFGVVGYIFGYCRAMKHATDLAFGPDR